MVTLFHAVASFAVGLDKVGFGVGVAVGFGVGVTVGAGADILKVRVWLAKYLLIPVTVTDPVPVFVLSAQERT